MEETANNDSTKTKEAFIIQKLLKKWKQTMDSA